MFNELTMQDTLLSSALPPLAAPCFCRRIGGCDALASVKEVSLQSIICFSSLFLSLLHILSLLFRSCFASSSPSTSGLCAQVHVHDSELAVDIMWAVNASRRKCACRLEWTNSFKPRRQATRQCQSKYATVASRSELLKALQQP